MASSSPQVDPRVANANARAFVLGASQKMIQQIYSNAVDPDNQPTLNIPARNVGLILGFIVVVSGGVTNGATNTATRSEFGSANAVRNFTFTDLNGVDRINTTGWHIALLNSVKQGWAFGGAYAPNLPMDYGNNWSPFAASASLEADATGTVKHTYYVPLAYGADDLRGAVYANVVNATQNLQVTLTNSAQLGVATGGDQLQACYIGNDNIAWTDNVTVTVYQVYLDQIPMVNGAPVLPLMDLNTVYDLKNTTYTGLTVGQDFPLPYANFREFLSTLVVFDNGGTYGVGADVNYFSLVSANATQLFKLDPDTSQLLARQILMADPPKGTYLFDSRSKPINTISYGNMTLNLNPSTVNNGAQVIMATEAFQQVNQIPIASSLQA